MTYCTRTYVVVDRVDPNQSIVLYLVLVVVETSHSRTVSTSNYAYSYVDYCTRRIHACTDTHHVGKTGQRPTSLLFPLERTKLAEPTANHQPGLGHNFSFPFSFNAPFKLIDNTLSSFCIFSTLKMTTTASSSSQPILPALYFEDERAPNSVSRHSTTNELPSEILSHCLSFADWGDLAKLACVQSSWSSIMTDAAENSNDAKWELAQALLHGTSGLKQNPRRALSILKELAQVDTNENNLPLIAQEEDMTSDDTVGFAPAMKAIAECYFEGNGVPKEPTTGLAWLQASFQLGKDLNGAHETAMLYEYGRNGIAVDVVAAAEWFKKAAQAGHVEAMAELGLCYELGCGLDQCDEQALDWYTKAANCGHATAKFSVAEAFEEARGVPQSDEEACLWYYRAALVGDEDSKKALRRLYDIARIVVPGVADILNV
jgi:TPR repeat protein